MDDMSRLQLENQCLKEQIASMDQAVKLLAEELASMTSECDELCLPSYTGLAEIIPLDSQTDRSIERIRYGGLVHKTAKGKAASAINVRLSAEVEELKTEKSRLNARNEELKARWEAERSKHEALDKTMSDAGPELTPGLFLLQFEYGTLADENSQLASEIKTKRQEFEDDKRNDAAAIRRLMEKKQELEVANGILRKELSDMGLLSGHPNKDPGAAVQDEQNISEVETTQMIRPEAEDSKTMNQECETPKKEIAGAATESKADRLRKELNDKGLRSGHPNKDPAGDAVQDEEIISEVETTQTIGPEAKDSETMNQECETTKKATAGAATESKEERLRTEIKRAYEETYGMQGQKREVEALHRQKEEESAEFVSKLNAAKREHSVGIEKLKAVVDRRQEEIESLRPWNDEAGKRLGSFKPESIRRHIEKLGEEAASASDIKAGEGRGMGTLSDWIRLESVVDELQMVRQQKAALLDEREELTGEIAELMGMIEGGSGCGAQTF